MSRQAYEVRVREQLGPTRWMKKSKFYNATGPQDAASKYKGKGSIMWVEKVKKEKLLGGVGEFFKLGDSLLQELRAPSLQEQLKARVRGRRNWFEKQRHQV